MSYVLNGTFEVSLLESGATFDDIFVLIYDMRQQEFKVRLSWLREELYRVISRVVKNYQSLYFPLFRGDIRDLIHDYWSDAVRPRFRHRKDADDSDPPMTLIDRYASVSGYKFKLPFESYVSFCIKHRLVDACRADSREGKFSILGSSAVRLDAFDRQGQGDSFLSVSGVFCDSYGRIPDSVSLSDLGPDAVASSATALRDKLERLEHSKRIRLERTYAQIRCTLPSVWVSFFDSVFGYASKCSVETVEPLALV